MTIVGRRAVALTILLAAFTGALASSAVAAEPPSCPNIPVNERIELAPIVFVGRILSERPGPGTLTIYRFRVLQPVKGELGREVELRGPELVDARGDILPRGVDLGVVAGRSEATPTVDSCGITNPTFLLANVDEPRGNGIRLIVGIVWFLGVIGLALALLRRRRRRGILPA
ncbi:MAG: hypothetical protein ACKVUT_12680 [Gaiella sp.]